MALRLNRTTWVNLPLGIDVGGVRLLWGIKRSKMNDLPVDSYGRLPSVAVSVCAKKLTRSVGCFCRTLILSIHRMSDIAKIGNRVICSVPVYVINAVRGPYPMHIEPRQSMLRDSFPLNHDAAISLRVRPRRDRPAHCSATSTDSPRKKSSLWVVMKKFAQTLRGKIGDSHEALQLLIGQRPRNVSSIVAASLF